jgi:nitrate reductase assembly molybdenum cofactor insertion protein NarJ
MNDTTRALLVEAAEWRLLSLLFEYPGPGWQTRVDSVATEAADARLKAAAAQAREHASEALYHTTLGPGGPAAAREVSYHQTLMPGQLLGEPTAYYRAFAYGPTVTEAPDHVAVETGFVAFLRLKEAYACERSDTDQTAVTAAAAQRFLTEHLSTMAEPLARSLAASGVPYLGQAAEVLLARTGPPPQRTRPSAESCPVGQADACPCAEDEALPQGQTVVPDSCM